MATLALGVVGGAAGFYVGGLQGAAIGFQLGVAAGGYLEGGTKQLQEGPRLQDLQVQTSRYGEPIPLLFGAFRIPGKVIWSGGITEHVHEDTEESGKGGSGPEVTTRTYSYSATWASAFCAGPVIGVSRIWFDSVLVYDVRSTAAADTVTNSRLFQSDHLTIYRGSPTQPPDATIEAAEGVGTVPGFHGLAYVVFEDIALADYGNRIPNVTAELFDPGTGEVTVADYKANPTGDHTGELYSVTHERSRGYFIAFTVPRDNVNVYPELCAIFDYNTKTFAKVFEQVTTSANRSSGGLYSSTGGTTPNRVFWRTKTAHRQLDLDSLTQVGSTAVSGSSSYSHYEETTGFMMYSLSGGGTIYGWSKSTTIAYSQTAAPAGYAWAPARARISGAAYCLQVLSKTADDQIALCQFTPGASVGGGSAGTVYDSGYLETDLALAAMVEDTRRGVVWAVLEEVVGNDFFLWKIAKTGELLSVENIGDIGTISTVRNNDGLEYDPFGDILCMHYGGSIYLRDLTLGTTRTLDPPSVNSDDKIAYNWLACELYKWDSTHDIGGTDYAVAHVVSLDCQDPGCQTLRATVERLGGACALTATTDADATALTGDVCGYLAGQQSGRAAIENLAAGYYFDGAESEGVIKYVHRGGASVATIDSDDMIVPGQGGPALVVTRGSELEIPRRMSIAYAQSEKLYQPGEAHAQRLVTDAVGEANTDMRLAMTADAAAKVADVLLFAGWSERTRFTFSIPVEHLRLDPSDVVTLTDGAATYTVRIVSVVQENLISLRIEAVEENPALYTSNALGAGGQPDADTVGVPGNTTLAFLNIPMLTDAGDGPLLQFALGGTSNAWHGARLYRSLDAGANYASIARTALGGTIATTTDTLATGTSPTWDDVSTVNVDLEHADKTLESRTDLAVLNGANAAALGADGRWEIIQFATATLEIDGTYTLSRLLRGRLGTEHNQDNHTSADSFVLLSQGLVLAFSVSQAVINQSHKYKPVTVGQDIADITDEDHTYTAENLRPWSPVHITGTRDGSNNLTINWVRRSRFLAAMLHDPILGEASEAYEVDIVGTSRTISATSETASYTAAEQTADGLTPGDPVEVNIYQLSETVGRGNAGNNTI